MTTSEAARLLGISQRRVRQIIAEGKLSAEPVHSHLVLVRRADVEAFAAMPRKIGWPKGKPRKPTAMEQDVEGTVRAGSSQKAPFQCDAIVRE